MSNILVVGSLGFDEIFSVNNSLRNEIPLTEGKINAINLMFTAKNKERYFGGTGGNIAYGLGLLGAKPLLFSVVGRDFLGEYAEHLRKVGVVSKPYIEKSGFSGTFYGISDKEGQQIGIWQPNVFGDLIEKTALISTITENELSEIKYAIFSPGTGPSTLNHIQELREKLQRQVTIIFDPSQELSTSFNKDLLENSLRLSDIFIGNEVEMLQLEKLYGLRPKNLFAMGISAVIETKGAEGSVIYEPAGETKVKPVRPERFIEATGAGDAYRAGLLFGLSRRMSLAEAAHLGAILGSKNVEYKGGQTYILDGKTVFA